MNKMLIGVLVVVMTGCSLDPPESEITANRCGTGVDQD